MGRGNDVVIGRHGDSLTGRVLDSSFEIETGLGVLAVATERIAWIHFRNPPQVPDDQLWLANGDRLTGALRRNGIEFQPQGGKPMSIPRERIHTVMIGHGLDAGARPLI